MTAAAWLRLGVCAVAMAGLIDPQMTSSPRPLLDVDVAVPRDPSSAPSSETGAAQVQLVRELATATSGAVRLRVRSFGQGQRLPCAADLPCVVITGGEVAARGGLQRVAPLLTLPPPPAGPVAGTVTLDDVQVTPAQVDERATAQVTVAASGAAGRTTLVEIHDGEVPAGSLRHTWTDTSPVTLEVPWWPARPGVRQLVITATTSGEDGRPEQRDRVAAPVEVAAEPWPVLIIDARSSWAATFVRRALEADARFEVDAVAALAPGMATGRGGTLVDDLRLARARVIVVGGLDAVAARDVARFDRFLRHRGGALVLVPDAAVTGPVTSLLPGRWRRRIEAEPTLAVPPPRADAGTDAGTDADALRASEWLLASDLAPGDEVLAAHDGAPAIVARAVGDGRVVVVGALDAWRFRLPGAADVEPAAGAAGTGGTARPPTTPLARVWQGMVADLARGTGAAVHVRVTSAPGDGDATIDVQAHTMDARQTWSAAARVVCGDAARPLRLWPQARAGHFRGRASWPPSGAGCDVIAAVAEVGEGHATLTAPSETRGEARRVTARLDRLARDTGGVAAAPGDVTAVAQVLAGLRQEPPAPLPLWPLRSWWWGLAAALGLGAEWWLRRTSGAR